MYTFLHLEERIVGLPGRMLREVFPLTSITPMPHSPHFILGLIQVRGKVLAVFDLCPFLGATEQTRIHLPRMLRLDLHGLEFVTPIETLSNPEVMMEEWKEHPKRESFPALGYQNITHPELELLNTSSLHALIDSRLRFSDLQE